jgi:hypothetical protein
MEPPSDKLLSREPEEVCSYLRLTRKGRLVQVQIVEADGAGLAVGLIILPTK